MLAEARVEDRQFSARAEWIKATEVRAVGTWVVIGQMFSMTETITSRRTVWQA